MDVNASAHRFALTDLDLLGPFAPSRVFVNVIDRISVEKRSLGALV
jgi:hypothetical protein